MRHKNIIDFEGNREFEIALTRDRALEFSFSLVEYKVAVFILGLKDEVMFLGIYEKLALGDKNVLNNMRKMFYRLEMKTP